MGNCCSFRSEENLLFLCNATSVNIPFNDLYGIRLECEIFKIENNGYIKIRVMFNNENYFMKARLAGCPYISDSQIYYVARIVSDKKLFIKLTRNIVDMDTPLAEIFFKNDLKLSDFIHNYCPK